MFVRLFLEIQFLYVTLAVVLQAGLELWILLLLPPEWVERRAPSRLTFKLAKSQRFIEVKSNLPALKHTVKHFVKFIVRNSVTSGTMGPFLHPLFLPQV